MSHEPLKVDWLVIRRLGVALVVLGTGLELYAFEVVNSIMYSCPANGCGYIPPPTYYVSILVAALIATTSGLALMLLSENRVVRSERRRLRLSGMLLTIAGAIMQVVPIALAFIIAFTYDCRAGGYCPTIPEPYGVLLPGYGLVSSIVGAVLLVSSELVSSGHREAKPSKSLEEETESLAQ